jgi:predicted RNA-binding Zn-ribbon protein involved in translation (DUF1610 family)
MEINSASASKFTFAKDVKFTCPDCGSVEIIPSTHAVREGTITFCQSCVNDFLSKHISPMKREVITND